MHTQVGFDLGTTKHYGSPLKARDMVEATLAPMIRDGVVFNILIVEQRRGGMGTNAEDRRYVPILNCWRVPETLPFGVASCMLVASRAGFTCFM